MKNEGFEPISSGGSTAVVVIIKDLKLYCVSNKHYVWFMGKKGIQNDITFSSDIKCGKVIEWVETLFIVRSMILRLNFVMAMLCPRERHLTSISLASLHCLW